MEGFVRLNGVCSECPPNSAYSVDTDSCHCDADHYWNEKTLTCDFIVCGENSHVSFYGDAYFCECEYEYVKQSGECVSRCAENKEYVNDQCVCVEGAVSIDGKCILCPEKSQISADRTECICDADHY